MSIADILLLLALAVVVLWTSRLAGNKGLNSWMWGIGSALLILVGWSFFRQFLGVVVMVPLVFLLLYKSPLFSRNRQQGSPPCPRCGAPETGGLNFCVQCGWDLTRAYGETATEEPPAPPAAEQPPVREPVAQRGDRTREIITEPASAEGPTAEPDTAAEPVSAQSDSPANAPREKEPAPAPPVAAKPQPRRIPTAASMTERGKALFSQGRFQEAIDQFTKAIALDPEYREAWEQRAAAYGRLGRAEQQANDQRHLEAI